MIKNRIVNSFFVSIFLIAILISCVGCRTKTSDYTVSMKQCARIIAGMNEYKDSYQKVPTKHQLINFMSQKGDSPETIVEWDFDQKNKEYFARKVFVTMDSGRKVDIIITVNSEFLILDSN
jgi:hypothetical protein